MKWYCNPAHVCKLYISLIQHFHGSNYVCYMTGFQMVTIPDYCVWVLYGWYTIGALTSFMLLMTIAKLSFNSKICHNNHPCSLSLWRWPASSLLKVHSFLNKPMITFTTKICYYKSLLKCASSFLNKQFFFFLFFWLYDTILSFQLFIFFFMEYIAKNGL
jgi:hypothetical protein